jgi:plastocyanin
LEYDGTDNDLLYASEISGEAFGLTAQVPNGMYEVTLHFSDWPYFELGENDRIQNVSIEDELVLESFLCQPGQAQVETFEQVEVTDGTLDIDLETHPDSLDPYAKINGVEIREVTEDDSSGGGDSPAADIELAAQSNYAWTGIAPTEVEGDNPTLTLTAGEEYTIAWTNENGAFHNFVIETEDGSKPVETELMSDQGQTQSVTFTATEGMTTYYCDPHQTLGMGGSIDIV